MADFNIGTASDINSWLNGAEPTPQTPSTEEKDVIENVVETIISESGEKPPVQEVEREKDVQDFINDEGSKGVEFFKDYEDLYSNLLDKNLAISLEEGYLPKSKDEFFNAMEQSMSHSITEKVGDLWKQKIDNLPDSLLRIHQYAEQGVTSAAQLLQFTQAVSQTEQIDRLDVTNEEDQEKIVLLQLLNSGMSKESAEDLVADLKDRDKLSSQAEQFYPSLRRTYNEKVQLLESQKRQEQEDINRWIDSNSSNVHFFLDEKNQDYIPFKISSNKDKSEIFSLAAQPISVRENGEVVYSWEEKIRSLQNGDEKSYKQFMKVMSFLANPSKYEDSISKTAVNSDKEKRFKKIVTTSTSTNNIPTEPYVNKQNNNKWSVR